MNPKLNISANPSGETRLAKAGISMSLNVKPTTAKNKMAAAEKRAMEADLDKVLLNRLQNRKNPTVLLRLAHYICIP